MGKCLRATSSLNLGVALVVWTSVPTATWIPTRFGGTESTLQKTLYPQRRLEGGTRLYFPSVVSVVIVVGWVSANPGRHLRVDLKPCFLAKKQPSIILNLMLTFSVSPQRARDGLRGATCCAWGVLRPWVYRCQNCSFRSFCGRRSGRGRATACVLVYLLGGKPADTFEFEARGAVPRATGEFGQSPVRPWHPGLRASAALADQRDTVLPDCSSSTAIPGTVGL